MKIKSKVSDTFDVELSAEELIIINNALNEICNDMSLNEFETRIGASLSEAQSLLREVNQALNMNSES